MSQIKKNTKTLLKKILVFFLYTKMPELIKKKKFWHFFYITIPELVKKKVPALFLMPELIKK
jgi:hypothetical protein